MRKILTAVEIEMSDEALSSMMKDADPDGSGEIDFEEFVIVLKRQMESDGDGDLSKVACLTLP